MELVIREPTLILQPPYRLPTTLVGRNDLKLNMFIEYMTVANYVQRPREKGMVGQVLSRVQQHE